MRVQIVGISVDHIQVRHSGVASREMRVLALAMPKPTGTSQGSYDNFKTLHLLQDEQRMVEIKQKNKDRLVTIWILFFFFCSAHCVDINLIILNSLPTYNILDASELKA